MISENELLNSKKFKFKDIQINVLEKDENDNVLVFSATFIHLKLSGQALSPGHIEINKTLWNENSSKRPKGYWVYESVEKDGIMNSILVSDEWLDLPKETKEEHKKKWN